MPNILQFGYFHETPKYYIGLVCGRGVWSVTAIILSMGHITEKRADHSLRDEQVCGNPLSFLCAVAPPSKRLR